MTSTCSARSAVDLRGPARARSGAAGQAAVVRLEQPGLDEPVEVERGERPAHAHGRRGSVPPDRIGRARHVQVQRPADGFGERRHGIEPRDEVGIVHGAHSIASQA